MDQYSVIKQLEYSLQALALEAGEQLKQFEDFAVATDELMLDFDHWSTVALGNYPDYFNVEQRNALIAINEFFDSYSEPSQLTIEEELNTLEWWKTLRTMATVALQLFGWQVKIPPMNRNPN